MEVVKFRSEAVQLLRRIMDHLDGAVQPFCERYGLTLMQLRLLLALYDEKQTVGGLGRQLHIAEANASSLCKRMEQQGYLSRVRSAEDERVVQVGLTERGRETVETVRRELEEKYAAVMESEQEEAPAVLVGLRTLDSLLVRMNAASKPNHKEA